MSSPNNGEKRTNTTYDGFDDQVDQSVQDLARQFTRQSYNHDVQGESSNGITDNSSTTSSIAPGINPITTADIDPRLDPNSEEFSSRYWIKNFQMLMQQDPDYYQPYSLGITYKDLRAFGNAVDADYQTTVVNGPLKMGTNLIRSLFQSKKDKETNTFDILKPMDALIEPGELVVVLGRPGSGCSTLLKTISANTHGFHVDKASQITYSGLSPKDIRNNYRGEIVYTAETDTHFANLTVWQTLSLAAKFRTPRNRIPGITRKQFSDHLTEVFMATYGLSHTKNTKVGGGTVRGVSGGERKRVTITEVSLAGAKVQCWDNATRGLDAATALEFIKALRTSTDVLGTTALVSIYQCSQDAYDLFDKVIVLYEGHQIFFGFVEHAKEFFINMGYECPDRQTAADFITSITSPLERKAKPGLEAQVPKTPEEFENYWKASPEYATLLKDIEASLDEGKLHSNKQYINTSHHASQAKNVRRSSPYLVSFGMQVRYLLVRDFQRIRNDIGFTSFNILSHCAMALILGSMFYNLPSTTSSFYHRGAALFFAVLFNGFSSFLEILTLYEARPIIEKHKQYALYRPSANALSSIITQVPVKLAISIGFNLFFYFIVNFRREPGRFFFYFLITFTSTFAMSHIFRVIGASTKSLPEAMVPASIILLALAMYVGFTIPVKYMIWARFINYLDPLAYAFEASMANEFSGRTFECDSYIPANPSTTVLEAGTFICNAVSAVAGETTVDGSKYIASSYQYYDKHKWRNFGITLAFAVFFLFVYLLVSEFNEGAKQKGEILLFQRSTLRKIRKQYGNVKNDLESGHEKEITGEELSEQVTNATIHTGTDIFHWKNVSYSVKIKDETRMILNSVDGWVKPGKLTALMGASGAGKTTLLDVLANRVTMGVITGDMFVNGHLRNSSFQRSTGYVQQQDIHLQTSTVREALLFSAKLRQPFSVPLKEKEEYVDDIIQLLELEKCKNAVVGVPGEGLNVEQRKRLTIGVELVAKPDLLLFLDEPTSGLDSQTAWSICQLMRKLADNGQAILCTIHQPSALLMQEFDRLLFLAKGGKTVYFGDLGEKCQTLIDYFERQGAPKCPDDANPAEWMLSVIGAAPGSHADRDYHEVWMNSEEHQQVLSELETMEKELVLLPRDLTPEHQKEIASPLWYQIGLVTQRNFQQVWRTPSYIWSKITLSIFVGLFIGFALFKSDRTQQGMQNQMFGVFMFTTIFMPLAQQGLPNYLLQRESYEVRERPSKTFNWKAFILAQIIVEIPWNVFIGTISFFCYYYPIGFYSNSEATHQVNQRGAYSWFFSVLYYIWVGTMSHMLIAPFEQDTTAGQIGSLCYTLSLSFCGVLVGPNKLGWWVWLYRVSPLTYFIEGYLSNAIANSEASCANNEYVYLNPPTNYTCAEYLDPFIEKAGTGSLINPDATSDCGFCSYSTTNAFLKALNLNFHNRWRDLGIFIVYIAFNIILAIFLYWLVRVPKKKNRVKNERSNPNEIPIVRTESRTSSMIHRGLSVASPLKRTISRVSSHVSNMVGGNRGIVNDDEDSDSRTVNKATSGDEA